MDKWCIQYDIMRAFPLLLTRAAPFVFYFFSYTPKICQKRKHKSFMQQQQYFSYHKSIKGF